MYDLDEDIQSDMHRFHRIWVDLEQEQYGGLTAERLILLVERLPAYEGAVASRIAWLQEEQKKRNPSRDRLQQMGVTQVDSTAGGLQQFGVEVVQAGGE